MSAPYFTDERLIEVHSRRMAGESWLEIAGDEWRHAQKMYSRAKEKGRLSRVLSAVAGEAAQVSAPVRSGAESGVEWAYSGDGATVSAPFGRIGTLAELLSAADVDLTRWYVDRWTVNSYEMAAKDSDGELHVEPLRKVQAWLRPVPGADVAAALRDSIIADMAKHAPRYAGVRYAGVRDGERHMLEVCTMDAHVGAYVWGEECGTDFDSDIARDLIGDAISQLAQRASGFPIDKVLLPLGNDLAHSDRQNAGAGGMTTKGTIVDVDTRRARLLRTIRMIAVESIDTLRAIAPVEVVMVKGNHDEDTIIALGEIVGAWYRNDPHVTVRSEPTPRKYVRYGTSLLGFTHGHNERHSELPLTMATEVPSDWAATTHREWHIGHLHRKGEAVSEHSGVRVRVMPSLAPEDAWHSAKAYKHLRAAEAYIWNFDTGYVGHFSVSLPGTLARAA